MKTLRYLLTAFAAFMLWSCSETPEPDLTTGPVYSGPTYGVYFPGQKNASDLELDPSEPTVLEFTARRTDSKGAITVPFETIQSEDGIFTFSPLTFEDGQEEATFTVSFPNSNIGTTYSCSVEITDPEYMNVYSENAAGFDFSVTRVKWNVVDADKTITYEGKSYPGYEFYTEDLVTTFFSVENVTYPVKVEVRDDSIDADYPNGPHGLAGIYRMVSPYGEMYPYNDPGDYTEGNVYIVINAEDPEKVYIEQQRMGFDWGYGAFVIWSLADYYQKSNSDADQYYGKIEAGAITFPKDALMIAMLDYNNAGLYQANTNGAFRLIVCQDQVVDYSLGLAGSEVKNGQVQIEVSMGADLKTVKYAFFEGSLNASLAQGYAESIASGDMQADGQITESGTLVAEFDTTGFYTMVAVGLDASQTYRVYDMYSFGYVAAGDEKPVVMNIGLDISDRYAGKGYTSENSAEMWAYGTDIVNVRFGLYKSSDLYGVSESVIRAVLMENGNTLSAADLSALNNGGITKLITNLASGTYYTLVMLADNGYVTKLFTAEALTAGEPHPLNTSYTINDLYMLNSKDELFKTWNVWAVDYFDNTNPRRQPVGKWTFSENTEDDDPEEEVDAINLDGLSFGYCDNDTQVWEYYDGVIYQLNAGKLLGTYGPYYLSTMIYNSKDGKLYTGSYALLGGIAADGYIAFVSGANGYDFNGICIYAYGDASLQSSVGAVELYTEIMLEDPAVASSASAAKTQHNAGQLKSLASEIAMTPTNFVELRGRERAHAIIDEMKARKNSIANRIVNTVAVDNTPAVRKADAKTSFEAGARTMNYNRQLKVKAGLDTGCKL